MPRGSSPGCASGTGLLWRPRCASWGQVGANGMGRMCVCMCGTHTPTHIQTHSFIFIDRVIRWCAGCSVLCLCCEGGRGDGGVSTMLAVCVSLVFQNLGFGALSSASTRHSDFACNDVTCGTDGTGIGRCACHACSGVVLEPVRAFLQHRALCPVTAISLSCRHHSRHKLPAGCPGCYPARRRHRGE